MAPVHGSRTYTAAGRTRPQGVRGAWRAGSVCSGARDAPRSGWGRARQREISQNTLSWWVRSRRTRDFIARLRAARKVERRDCLLLELSFHYFRAAVARGQRTPRAAKLEKGITATTVPAAQNLRLHRGKLLLVRGRSEGDSFGGYHGF